MRNEIAQLLTILISVVLVGLALTVTVIWLIDIRTSFKIVLTSFLVAIVSYNAILLARTFLKKE